MGPARTLSGWWSVIAAILDGMARHRPRHFRWSLVAGGRSVEPSTAEQEMRSQPSTTMKIKTWGRKRENPKHLLRAASSLSEWQWKKVVLKRNENKNKIRHDKHNKRLIPGLCRAFFLLSKFKVNGKGSLAKKRGDGLKTIVFFATLFLQDHERLWNSI